MMRRSRRSSTAIQLLRCPAHALARARSARPPGRTRQHWRTLLGLPASSGDKSTRHIAGPRLAKVRFPFLLSWTRRPPGQSRRRSSSSGGDEGTRTPDFCFAKAALSQLSYIPVSLAFSSQPLLDLTAEGCPLPQVGLPPAPICGVPGFGPPGDTPPAVIPTLGALLASGGPFRIRT